VAAAQHVDGSGARRDEGGGGRRLQAPATARLGRDGLEGVVPPEDGISGLEFTFFWLEKEINKTEQLKEGGKQQKENLVMIKML
jgi:hypothetical protein